MSLKLFNLFVSGPNTKGVTTTNGYVLDISEGGCALRIYRQVVAGDVGRVQLELDTGTMWMPIVVRWARPDARGWIAGTEFDRLTRDRSEFGDFGLGTGPQPPENEQFFLVGLGGAACGFQPSTRRDAGAVARAFQASNFGCCNRAARAPFDGQRVRCRAARHSE